MRQFYLSKNNHGYYRVVFVDPATGWQSVGKSTGTKDKIEATMIATTWLKEGVPSGRTGTRAFLNSPTISVSKNLQSIVQGLTEAEAVKLVEMISRKFNLSDKAPLLSENKENEIKNEIPKIIIQKAPVRETKKRVVIVRKKSGLNEEDVSDLPKLKLCDTLENFWDYDKSEFIERYVAYGHSMTRKHAFCMHAYVRNYWRPYWGDDTTIEDLTKPELDDFFFYLYREVALSGDVSEQCLFILWGTGANGKSTFLNVLTQLFGDYAISTPIETFMKKNSEQSNDLARLKGARLVTTSEIEQGKQMSESLIKTVTGEDDLTARFLYGEYFSFKPTFKIFMATNHKPKIRGADNGIWRRIKMIPFTVTIPPEQRDKKLTDKLIAENSGILNWLIQGYAMWKKEGLGKEPDAIREANEEYRMDMDSVGTFVNDCFDLDASMRWRLPNQMLYQTYIKWCNANNERIMSQKWLTMRMSEKGFKRMVSNTGRIWLGLARKPQWEK